MNRSSDGSAGTLTTRQTDPKTVRVTCPHCDSKSAFATVPEECTVVAGPPADDKVRSVCRQCDEEFFTHFERP